MTRRPAWPRDQRRRRRGRWPISPATPRQRESRIMLRGIGHLLQHEGITPPASGSGSDQSFMASCPAPQGVAFAPAATQKRPAAVRWQGSGASAHGRGGGGRSSGWRPTHAAAKVRATRSVVHGCSFACRVNAVITTAVASDDFLYGREPASAVSAAPLPPSLQGRAPRWPAESSG